jgi:signal recognition particle GTPase
MIDKLVMDTARIKILKALASSYIREDQHGVKSTLPPWNADFIQGKGQGQIILLHGKPGVGKTLTAGKVACSVKNLYSINFRTRMHRRIYQAAFDGTNK